MTIRAIRLVFMLAALAGLLSCDVSNTSKPDTLTFRLPDSLKVTVGKYDTVQLDLYRISGSDTEFVGTLFRDAYENPAQLANLLLPEGLDGNFLVRVSGIKDGRKTLDLGVAFANGQASKQPITYPIPVIPVNRAPAFTAGLEARSLREGESLSVTLKAQDEDGDAVTLSVQNLDSLRGLFPNRPEAITVTVHADSLVLRFDPGAAPGNYRFRVAVSDSAGAFDVQVLVLTVGKVNRPPTLSFAAPNPGPAYRVHEGQTLSLRVVAIDPDSGDRVRLLPLEQTPWPACGSGSYDTATGILTFTPGFACVANGETSLPRLDFRAADDGTPKEMGEISSTITVVDSNSAPRWAAGPVALTGKEGKGMSLDLGELFLGDAEHDSVTFSATCGAITTQPFLWTYTPGFRDSGQKVCTLTATDSHQPPDSSQLTLQLTIADSARALEVDILAPARGAYFRDSMIQVSWQIEGVPQTRETSEKLLKEGANLVRRSFRDSLGNEGFDTLTVFLDTQAPGKTQVRSPGWTNQVKPRWTWKSGGGGTGQYRVRLDTMNLTQGGASVNDTAYTAPWNLAEGRHVLYVQERDQAGNWSPIDSGTARVDVTPPAVVITGPANGHVTNQASVTVAWSVDGNTQTPFTQTLTEGGNTISRTVTDSAGNAGSKSITVTRRSNVVFVNAAAAAGGDGNSWATATKSLQAGLAKAQSGWEIWVAKGSYSPLDGLTGVFDTSFAMKLGVGILGGFAGTENDKQMRNWSTNETILTGEKGDTTISDNLGRIVTGANNSTLDGFTVQRAYTVAGSLPGAIVNDRVSPIIQNCIFRENVSSAPDQGTSVMFNSLSNPTIKNCQFLRNRSIYDVSVIWNLSASPIITNCQFLNNVSGNNSIIENSGASNGTFSQCVFANNTGGAIANNQGRPTVSGCIFYKNTSQVGGGAIWGAVGKIVNTLFVKNSTPGIGGAVTAFETVEFLNCTFYENIAGEGGGAVFHRTFEDGVSIAFKNSIFWGNLSSVGSNNLHIANPAALIASFSNFQSLDSTNASTVSIGPGMLEAYPSFLDVSNPAGPDGKYFTSDDGFRLFGGPCINTGDPSTTGLPSADIAGGARIIGGRVDMGAYEN